MSENIEKAVQTEESSETKGTDNVVLYPVSDEEKTVSAAQETSDTESKATDGKTADNTNKFSDTQNTKEASPKDAEEDDDDDLEEDFYEQNFRKKMRKKTKTWKKTSTNNRKNPAPKMSIRSANFSPISVPNARSR